MRKRRSYGFDRLAMGKTLVFSCGPGGDYESEKLIRNAAYVYAHHHGVKFAFEAERSNGGSCIQTMRRKA